MAEQDKKIFLAFGYQDDLSFSRLEENLKLSKILENVQIIHLTDRANLYNWLLANKPEDGNWGDENSTPARVIGILINPALGEILDSIEDLFSYLTNITSRLATISRYFDNRHELAQTLSFMEKRIERVIIERKKGEE